ISLPHESVFASTPGLQFEGLARALLILAARGDGPAPVSEQELWKGLSGLHVFNSGQFAIQRSDRAIASFSWGWQIMGLCVPMNKDLLLTPCERSMIGFVAVDGISDRPAIKRV